MLVVEVITPQQKILNSEASEILVSTLAGEIGILPGHANLLSIITSGRLQIKTNNQPDKNLFVKDGFVSVSLDKVMVVVKSCQKDSPQVEEANPIH